MIRAAKAIIGKQAAAGAKKECRVWFSSRAGYYKSAVITKERCEMPKKFKEGLANPFMNLIKNNRPLIHQYRSDNLV